MRLSFSRKNEPGRCVETVSMIEETLGRAFGMIQLETGRNPSLNGDVRIDYVLTLEDREEARQLARAMQFRGVASGVRTEIGRYALRISKNDLIQAFLDPERYMLEGTTARQVLEEKAAARPPMLNPLTDALGLDELEAIA